jgi:osmoprotectant transport system substrate-binding protein
MLDQTPFNDNQAIAVQRSFSEENGITTLSQLAEWGQDNEIVISAPVDFETRPDGLVGLQNVYDAGFENATVLGVDPGIKYDALNAGDANVVLAFGTDAEIQQFDLIVLQDDQGLFPPGHAAPVVRQAVIDVYPNIPDVLNAVIPLLTNEAQIGLNAAVVIDGGDPADVARQFLIDNGLISA